MVRYCTNFFVVRPWVTSFEDFFAFGRLFFGFRIAFHTCYCVVRTCTAHCYGNAESASTKSYMPGRMTTIQVLQNTGQSELVGSRQKSRSACTEFSWNHDTGAWNDLLNGTPHSILRKCIDALPWGRHIDSTAFVIKCPRGIALNRLELYVQ